MITEEQIAQLATGGLGDKGNYIVDISVKPGNKIVVLLDNDEGVGIDDCITMSRQIESNLDREVEDFELNVMSPGLSEPFLILKQYQKNIGKRVDVIAKGGIKYTGTLLSADESGIVLETKTSERVEGKKKKQEIINNVELRFEDIKQTKLVLLF